jgi:hypothetical protein
MTATDHSITALPFVGDRPSEKPADFRAAFGWCNQQAISNKTMRSGGSTRSRFCDTRPPWITISTRPIGPCRRPRRNPGKEIGLNAKKTVAPVGQP